ncbi:MAG: GspH/FimT family pseudopilin [Methylobacillus sp.]|jgi:type IV fimbrial biogenesis protein FimT|nr:GspH/FimT family pseudopilin [Methylobacillus sp.]
MHKTSKAARLGSYRGFTMIELMIAIVVMGVLLALALPSFNDLFMRYRVSTASAQITNALQFARASAISSRSNTGVSSAAQCLEKDDWSCGVHVWRDPENKGEEDLTLLEDTNDPTSKVNPRKTIDASSFKRVNARFVSSSGQENVIYSPLGFAVGANGVVAATSAIYVWPADWDDPQTRPEYTHTICLGVGGKISVVSGWVDITSGNQCG